MSHELLERMGREVLVWLDPEDLSKITITEDDLTDPLVVPRAEPVPAMGRFAGKRSAPRCACRRQTLLSGGRHFACSETGPAGVFRPIITDAKSKRLVMEFKQRNEEFDAARVSEVEARRSASRAARKLADVAPEKIDEMEAELIARGVLLEVECSIALPNSSGNAAPWS